MFPLYVHDDAQNDIDELWETEPDAAAGILVVLQELQGNEQLRDGLLEHRFGSNHSADFEVQKWVEQWQQKRDLWRLKVWALEDIGIRYRVIYAYSIRRKSYHVLAVVHRDFDYAEDHPVSQRVLRAYRDL